MLFIFDKSCRGGVQPLRYKQLVEDLPKSRKEKLNKLKTEQDKLICVIEYYAVKKLLKLKTNQDFSYTSNGKPYIEGKKHFSISHSNNLLCIASSSQPISVDVQPIEYNEEVANFICTPSELNNLKTAKNKAKELTKLFTKKESAIKCLDLNLTHIKTVLENKNLRFKTKQKQNYLITICKQKTKKAN